MGHWQLVRGDTKLGPYSLGELRQMAAVGQLFPEDSLLPVGAQETVAASTVAGLFGDDAVTSTPLPPRVDRRPDRRAYDDEDDDDVPELAPPLWNPTAAALWSLVFSPAFGACLHALNWRALGDPGKARANFAWMWVSSAFLVVAMGSGLLPESPAVEGAFRIIGLGLMAGWYFSLGQRQVVFVRDNFRDGYVRRSWAAPIGIAVGILVAFVLLTLAIVIVFDIPDA